VVSARSGSGLLPSDEMFILYAIVAGLLIGFLLGGRLEAIADTHFRWGWLAILALAIQLVLFSPLGAGLGDATRWIYLVSTALVVIVVVANLRLPGLPIILLGALANLAAIVANGGSMPASPAALAALGGSVHHGPTNSVVLEHPALEPLTDIFAMPAWIPFANIFSIGDVLIAIGVAVALAAAMRPRIGRRA
jgi:Family of unknown function (DUF5317)